MNPHNSNLKVIIVHENSVTGIQAGDVLRRLSDQLGEQMGIDISPWHFCDRAWQFEWLQDPQLWEEAVVKAVEADMIIISAACHTALPACVRNWIENVLPRKQGVSALVALLDGQSEANALSPAGYLRQLARQHGVDFFCNHDERVPLVEPAVEPNFCWIEDDSAPLDEAMAQNSDPHGWGIND